MAAVQQCDINTIVRGSKCFSCFSEIENQAAIVYFLNQRFAQLNGSAQQTVNQLRSAIQQFANSSVDMVADNFDAYVSQQGAIAAGVPGASTQTIAQIRAAVKGFANTSLSELRSMEVLLRCRLNQFP